jgi:hypothetical protein
MTFHQSMIEISKEFSALCLRHEATARQLSSYDVSTDVYHLMQELYDKDKEIRVQDSLSLDSVAKTLEELRRDVNNIQFEKNNRIFRDRFINHIETNQSLITLVKKALDAGRLCKSLEDRVIFLLNLCILLDQTAYFQSLFISKLDELNQEAVGISNADYSLFFRIGSLNFKRHLYPEATNSLNRAIDIMSNVMVMPAFQSNLLLQQAEFKAMLFKAKMLVAVSCEFQGRFDETIEMLIGNGVVQSLNAISLDEFLYSTGSCTSVNGTNTLDVIIDDTENQVIGKVDSRIVNLLLEKCKDTSCLKYAYEIDVWFFNLTDEEKKTLNYLGKDDSIDITPIFAAGLTVTEYNEFS